MPENRRLGQNLSAEGARVPHGAGKLIPAFGWALALGFVLAGCAKDISRYPVQQFDPAPPVTIGAEDVDMLSPVCGRQINEALQDADREFQAANAAQNAGDADASMKHYARMLEILIAADLDPSAFYSLRDAFDSILEVSPEHARMYESRRQWGLGQGGMPGASYSNIVLPYPLPERVLVEIEELQTRYPKNFQRGLNESARYRPYIEAELEKAGLPTELIWLAMVESLFTPKIVSRAGAGGMWQFMRATASHYNIRMDSYVDERYNWQSSTRAAIAHLKDLHNAFGGDWALAISAYNMGQGGMQRSIDANGGDRDFWRLIEEPPASHRIKLETKKYYPRFLAYMIVCNNPERYGFTPGNLPPEDTVRIPVRGMYALDDLDKAMGFDPGTLARLNPDLLRETTPPTGEYPVAVPAEKREQFAALVQSYTDGSAPEGTHRVRSRETLAQIAAQYEVSERELMRVNGLRSASQLQAGRILRIPTTETGQGGSNMTPAAAPASREKVYQVKRGDSLFDIASAHNISVEELQQWNGLGQRSRISVGQKLTVSAPDRPVSPAPQLAPAPATAPDIRLASGTGQRVHVVKSKESPYLIAKQYGVPLDDLLAWNGLNKDSRIRVGERLRVSTPESGSGDVVLASASPERSERKIVHKAVRNDTAGKIAAKYGVKTADFLKWNNLTAKSVILLGRNYVVYVPGEADSAASEERTLLASAPPPSVRTVEETPPKLHRAVKNDTAGKIAAQYGVKTADFLKWNNLKERSVINIGKEYIVSPGEVPVPRAAPAPDEPILTASIALRPDIQRAAPTPGQRMHKAAAGDTAGKIAAKYGVKTADFMKWNGLTGRSVIQIGREYVVYTNGAAPSEQTAVAVLKHKAVAGDTAGKIAQKYGIKTSDFLKWNNLTEKSVIQLGREYIVYGPAAASVLAQNQGSNDKIVHVVSTGQNPTTIARHYKVKVNDLFLWNGWGASHVLRVGDKVTIHKN